MSDTDTEVLYEEPEYYEYYDDQIRRWKWKYWVPGLLLFVTEALLFLFVDGAFALGALLLMIAGIFLPIGLQCNRRGMAWVGLIALTLAVIVSMWEINHPLTSASSSATPGNYGSSQSQATAAVSTETMTSSASAEPTTVVASETPSATPEPTPTATTSAKPKPSVTKAPVKTTQPSVDSFPQQQVAPDPTPDPQPSVTPTFNGNGGQINQGQIPQPG